MGIARRRPEPRQVWTGVAATRLCQLAGGSCTVPEAVRVVVASLLRDIPCPPTDLRALASRVGVAAIRQEDIAGTGELRRERGQLVIVYASAQARGRARFTIAHEIAHAIFEGTGSRPPRVGRTVERICDMLATEILLPTEVFAAHAGPQPSVQRVFDLAARFEASLTATALRCCELGGGAMLEVEDGEAVRSWGPVRTVRPELRPAVEQARRGQRVSMVVELLESGGHVRPWRLDCAPLGAGGRALMLLWPQRRAATSELDGATPVLLPPIPAGDDR